MKRWLSFVVALLLVFPLLFSCACQSMGLGENPGTEFGDGEKTGPAGDPGISGGTGAESENVPTEEKNGLYKEAEKLEKQGNYGAAGIAFAKCGDYADAQDRSYVCWSKRSCYIKKSVVLYGNLLYWIGNKGKVQYKALAKEERTIAFQRTEENTVWDFPEDEKMESTKNWEKIVSIAVTGDVIAGLNADGAVVVNEGYGSFMYDDRSTVADVVATWKDVVSIAVGDPTDEKEAPSLMALHADGTVSLLVLKTNTSAPYWDTWIQKWTDIIAIGINEEYEHFVGIKADGSVVCNFYSREGSNWGNAMNEMTGGISEADHFNTLENLWSRSLFGNFTFAISKNGKLCNPFSYDTWAEHREAFLKEYEAEEDDPEYLEEMRIMMDAYTSVLQSLLSLENVADIVEYTSFEDNARFLVLFKDGKCAAYECEGDMENFQATFRPCALPGSDGIYEGEIPGKVREIHPIEEAIIMVTNRGEISLLCCKREIMESNGYDYRSYDMLLPGTIVESALVL